MKWLIDQRAKHAKHAYTTSYELFSCKACSKQYTGSNESFRSRFNNYKSAHSNYIKENTVKQELFHAHFEDDKHHG